jgi:DNA polymerase-1
MAEDFRAGLDPHRQTAIRLLGERDTPSDEERQFGKTFNFASIYGAGANKIKTMLADEGLSLPEGKTAKQLHTEFYALNPGIRALSNPRPRWNDNSWVPGHIEKILESRGYIRTLWGRELHPEYAYRALNSLVQGCAADLMRAGMVKVHDWITEAKLESHLVMTVHDELIFDVVDEEFDLLVGMVPKLMTDARLEEILPIEVELETSRTTWAEKEPYG